MRVSQQLVNIGDYLLFHLCLMYFPDQCKQIEKVAVLHSSLSLLHYSCCIQYLGPWVLGCCTDVNKSVSSEVLMTRGEHSVERKILHHQILSCKDYSYTLRTLRPYVALHNKSRPLEPDVIPASRSLDVN